VCCSVLQCVAVFFVVFQSVIAEKQYNTLHNTLQHTTTRCNALQHTYTNLGRQRSNSSKGHGIGESNICIYTYEFTTAHCNTLQHTATHCYTLQHTATRCNTRIRTLGSRAARIEKDMTFKIVIYIYIYILTYISTQKHVAAPYNTLRHTATHCNTLQHAATRCNTLQHTATHCDTLRHTVAHCKSRTLDGSAARIEDANANRRYPPVNICVLQRVAVRDTLQHAATHINRKSQRK